MPHIFDFLPLDTPVLSLLLQNVEKKEAPKSKEHRQERAIEGDGSKQPDKKGEAGKG